MANLADFQEIEGDPSVPGYTDAYEFLSVFKKIADDNKKLEEENQVLRLQFQNYTEKSQTVKQIDYEKEILTVLQEKDRLNTQKDTLLKEKNLLQGQIDNNTNTIRSFDRQIGQLQEECQTFQTNNNEIIEKLNLIKADVKLNLEQISKLRDQKAQLEIEIRTYEGQIESNQEVILSKHPEKLLPKFDTFVSSRRAHQKAINEICFSPDNQTYYTIGEDKVLSMWSTEDHSLLKSYNLPAVQISASMQTEGNYLCLSGADKVVRLFDTKAFRTTVELKNHTGECTSSIWCSTSNILSASKDRTVKMFDLSTNTVVYTAMAASAVNSICKTDDPSVYAAACQDRSIRIIDSRLKKVVEKIDNIHESALVAIEFDKNKNLLVSIGLDNRVCLTDIRMKTRLEQFMHEDLDINYAGTKISINKENGLFYVGTDSGNVFLFDTDKFSAPTILQKSHESPVYCSASNSSMLLTADASGTIVCWK